MSETAKQPLQADRIATYFKEEKGPLAAVTVSGLIYNLGLLASPWFEGQMAGCLVAVLNKQAGETQMLYLVACYLLAVIVVQAARYIKRFYVRRFANNVNRRMKQLLYSNLLSKSKCELEQEGSGSLITKAIMDVDDCAEGMRKFTTELFDTGVALTAYVVMLLCYDWRLALLTLLCTPIAYLLAEKLKVVVQRSGAAYKEQAGLLNAATLDRATNALTYRVYGCEEERSTSYEKRLAAYETAAIRSNICNTIMQPLYRSLSLTGVLFIIYFGSRNVLGSGWSSWDIAAFTTFLSCFLRLAQKSSGAAKLFNAVHKAQVSWQRIRPLLRNVPAQQEYPPQQAKTLVVNDLGFAYPEGSPVFSGLSFNASPGQIIGVTGAVACGKSTLGKSFLCEYPYQGSIRFNGAELSELTAEKRHCCVGYLGHEPELFADTIKNNILLAQEATDVQPYLRAVRLDEEVAAMACKEETRIGDSGVRLSGGQAQRLALARTLCHARPLLILDDPFSALDRMTEQQLFAELKNFAKGRIILLLSHRLYLFPQLEQVIWLENGRAAVGTHAGLLQQEPGYARLYYKQEGGAEHE